MPSKYWIKLYHEILDDFKMQTMSHETWRRTIELFLMAGELDQGGMLPEIEKIAWRLRDTHENITAVCYELVTRGILTVTDSGNYFVAKFQERQSPSPTVERMKEYRKRQRSETVTNRNENVTENVTTVTQDSVICNLLSVNLIKLYEENIGFLTPILAEKIALAEKEYPAEWFEPAVEAAVRQNKRSWSYIEAILRRWKIDGFQVDSRKKQPTLEDLGYTYVGS